MTHAPRQLGVRNIDKARSGPARATHAAAAAAAAMAAVSCVATLIADPATRPRGSVTGRAAVTETAAAAEELAPIETGAA